MVRRMLLAGLGAGVAHLSADPAHRLRERRQPTHPIRRERADVRTVPAESDAPRHQFVIAVRRHPDHVVRAGIADLGTGPAGRNAGFVLFQRSSAVVMHDDSSAGVRYAIDGARTGPMVRRRQGEKQMAGG
jgi:hypothetical protein